MRKLRLKNQFKLDRCQVDIIIQRIHICFAIISETEAKKPFILNDPMRSDQALILPAMSFVCSISLTNDDFTIIGHLYNRPNGNKLEQLKTEFLPICGHISIERNLT